MAFARFTEQGSNEELIINSDHVISIRPVAGGAALDLTSVQSDKRNLVHVTDDPLRVAQKFKAHEI